MTDLNKIRTDILKWLQSEHDGWPTLSEHDGQPFLIVESWEQVNLINDRLELLADEELQDIDDLFHWSEAGWGFSDEHDTCAHCYHAIRTQADSYMWVADFWRDDDGILCGDCVRTDFADDYIDHLVEKSVRGESAACTVLGPNDLKLYGFSEVISGMENGLHHGQADSPQALVLWATDHDFQAVFTIQASQFYVTFDLWLRPTQTQYDGQVGLLTDLEALQIREALLVDPTDKHSGLRSDFREYPTPAMRCEAALKNVSGKPGYHKVVY